MGTRQRHCAPRDLCAWLRFAPVPAFLKNIPKDLDHTFPTRYASSSPLSSLLPPQTGSCSLTLHYTVLVFAHHPKESGTGGAEVCHPVAAPRKFKRPENAWQRRLTTMDDDKASRRQRPLLGISQTRNITRRAGHCALR